MKTVYFDMDRVLVDFAASAEKYRVLRKNNKINWLKVFFLGSRFWSNMDFFPDAQKAYNEIYSYCQDKNIAVKILSSVKLPSGRKGKYTWCKEKLGIDRENVILVLNGKSKACYADGNTLLIDDSTLNVTIFRAAGGKAVCFNNWNKEMIGTIIDIINGTVKNE